MATDNKLKVKINSLKKQNKSLIYSEEYLDEISNYLVNTLTSKIDREKIKQCILNSYIAIRKDYNFSKLQDIEYIDNNFNVFIYEQNNELCIDIWRKNYEK